MRFLGQTARLYTTSMDVAPPPGAPRERAACRSRLACAAADERRRYKLLPHCRSKGAIAEFTAMAIAALHAAMLRITPGPRGLGKPADTKAGASPTRGYSQCA